MPVFPNFYLWEKIRFFPGSSEIGLHGRVDFIIRVTIRPDLGGTVPLFEALSRLNHRKSRFFVKRASTAWTRILILGSQMCSPKKKRVTICLAARFVSSLAQNWHKKCSQTGDDLFFLEINPNLSFFSFWRSWSPPWQTGSGPEFQRPAFVEKEWYAHIFGLVKSGHPLSRFLLFQIW